MRSKIVILLLSFLCSTSWAEGFVIQKPMICVDLPDLLKSLKDSHKELPVFIANDSSDKTKYSLFINQKTGTWTMIQFVDDVACIVGFGTEAKVVLGNKI